MSNKKPQIRFQGVVGDWEQREFSESFNYLQNNSLSRENLNYEKGLVKNVHYGDVLIKFGEVLDVGSAEIPFISNNEFNVSSASLLQDGDVIIADAAEDETVGKCSEIMGINGTRVVSGLHTIPCRPTKKFATGYLGYYMNSFAYHDQLLPLIQGTKISSISKSALKNTYITYPVSEEEQREIGTYFQQLDNFIIHHQCELTKLTQFKQGMLQKMFPKEGEKEPEIRFDGFTGEWEEVSLSDVAQVTMGQSPAGRNYTSNPNDNILVQGNADMTNGEVVPRVWTTEITKTAIPGDIIFSVRAPVGDVGKTKYNVVLGRGVAGIRGNRFVFSYLEYLKNIRYWDTFSTGSTFQSINSNNLKELNLKVPSVNEQKQIGDYFNILDKNIQSKRAELEKLKQFKQAMLDKIFV